jgi:ABC-type multidrug transport system fused ATPase/permease subunit
MQSFLFGWVFLGLMFLDPIILNALLNAVASTSHPVPASSYTPAPAAPALSRELGAQKYAAEAAGVEGGGGGGAEGGGGLFYKFALVLALSASMLVRVTCMEFCYFTSVRSTNNSRSTLIMAIFASVLDSNLSVSDTGRLTNLMATDADKFGKSEWLVWFAATFTFALISLPAVICMLYQLLGSAAFIGFFTLLLTTSSSTIMSSFIRPVVQRLQTRRDARGQLLSGLLQGMQLVKLQGCHAFYERQVSEARELEMLELKWLRYLTAANTLVGALLSISVPVSMFSWYTLVQGKVLDASTAFTALAWIGQLRWSINSLPAIYTVFATIRPSAVRLAEVLFASRPRAKNDATRASRRAWGRGAEALVLEGEGGGGQGGGTEFSIVMEEGRMCYGRGAVGEEEARERGQEGRVEAWRAGQEARGEGRGRHEARSRREAEDAEAGEVAALLAGGEGWQAGEVENVVLEDVNLVLRRGQFLVICGEVGAGKSTLLAALAQALPLSGGRVMVTGSLN